ncbi:MAG: asparagine synthetase B [Candidatus Bathyarchaeia archaeon]|jgi:asparagine synthase (glutamine-hydrolysing)
MKVTIAVLDKHGDNVVDQVLEVLNALGARQSSHFGLISPKKSVFEKSLGILRRQGLISTTIVGYVSSKPESASGYEFLQLDDAALIFEGRVYSPIPKTAVMEQVAKEPLHCETILQTLIANADGDYSFLTLKDGWVAAGRDPVGVQPLYYGENQNIAALATNRKALWKLGIEKTLSFPPGNISFVNREGFQFKPVKTLSYTEPTQTTIDEAAKKLQALLEESIQRRIRDVKEVVVAFSGGLDSSIVAYLTSKLGVKVSLLHVSMENQAETEEAIDASNQLNLPLQVHLFKDSDVEKTLPQVVALIEEPDPIKASVGLPFYWGAEKASEANFSVMLAGQGADELFGGYQRYVNEYCKEGNEKVRKTMFNDVVRIHESNLERDLKITNFHDVELRLPFASFELADFALSLPVECKMEQKPDTLRKLVLRKVALNVGMPSSVVDKPKKAVQYSTGINNAIKRVAKKHQKTVNEYINGLLQESKR